MIMQFMEILGLLGIGGILGSIVQHFLSRSTIAADRIYIYRKEELLRYKKIAEEIIGKLMLLEGYRELFRIYIDLNYQASLKKNGKFIDLNNTLNKSDFENNREMVATTIFLYFSELSEDWNILLDGISEMATIINQIELRNSTGNVIAWKEYIEEFNILNQGLGDKPLNLSKEIKNIISQKEIEIINQKPKFYFI